MDESKYTYVFIDESGDSGFKLNSGSTQIFCIAAVIFGSTKDIEATDAVMQALKPTLGLKKTHEYHFHKEPQDFRVTFCKAVCRCPFTVRAIVVDKLCIYEESSLRRSPQRFYNHITRVLFDYSFSSITNAKVRIDGSMNRELKDYLRKQLNRESKIIHDTKFLDSKLTPMIQLADMIAGSIARSYKTEKKDCWELRRILKPCLSDVWDFGEDK